MFCPYCHNEIKEIEQCPQCKQNMVFKPREGPTGTWECENCSTEKQIIGYRTTPYGLMKANDLVGRYAVKET